MKDAALLAIKRDLDPLPYYLTYDLTLPDGNSIKLTLTKRSELSPADFRIKFHNPELDELEYTSLEVSELITFMSQIVWVVKIM